MREEKVKELIKEAVKKHLPTGCEVFIFGSRATGKFLPWSDFDVGILGPKKIPSYLIVKIQEELENSSIPYKIDVVDFKKVSSQFRNLALKEAIRL